jgi:hypothetical protein
MKNSLKCIKILFPLILVSLTSKVVLAEASGLLENHSDEYLSKSMAFNNQSHTEILTPIADLSTDSFVDSTRLDRFIENSDLKNAKRDHEIDNKDTKSTQSKNSTAIVAQIPPATSALPLVPAAFSDIKLTKPTSPAAKLIGVDGKITPTITTPSQFGFEVLNGLDNGGKFNTGIAVDMLPYVLIRGNELTLDDYKKSDFQWFLSNTKLSIATTKSLDDIGARAGLGIEFTILNNGDLRRDQEYQDKIIDLQQKLILKKFRDAGGPGKLSGAEQKAILDASDVNIEAVKKEAEQLSGQKAIWTAAIGQSWVSPTGLYSDLRGEGMGLWTTYSMGVGGNSQLLIHASLRNGEQLKLNNNNVVNANTLVGGIRYQTGDSNFRFSLETAYNRESHNGQQINDYLSFGIGLEPRIFDNSWLSLSLGGTSGKQDSNDFQFKTGIKWNINPGYLSK